MRILLAVGIACLLLTGCGGRQSASLTLEAETPIPTAAVVQPPSSTASTPAVVTPAPPTDPLGTVDAQAAALAAQVLAGGEGASPALRMALHASGIAVRGPRSRGSPLTKAAEPAQGLVFDDWEIEALLRLTRNHMSMPFADLVMVVEQVLAPRSGFPTSELLLDGLRRHAGDTIPTLRFWSRFILELGRQGQGAYDLTSAGDLGRVRVDAIQTALILRRLAADLALRARADGVRHGVSPERPGEPRVRPAVMGGAAPLLLLVKTLPNCDFEAGPITPDTFAAGIGLGFGKLIEIYEDAADTGVSKIGKYAGYAGLANAFMAYVNLVYTYVALDISVMMENSPLRRVKEPERGERRQLIAEVRIDSGGLEALNCLRLVSIYFGLDLEVPADGKVSDALVQWTLVEGGEVERLTFGARRQEPVVELENPGPRFQDAGVGIHHISTFTSSRTDAEGRARQGVWGAKRKRKISEPAVEVQKTFTVRVNVAVEPATYQDSLATGIGLLGGPSGLVTLPADLIKKTRWASSGDYSFPVIDWEEGLLLTFESQIRGPVVPAPMKSEVRSVARAHVVLQDDASKGTLTGKAPLKYETVTTRPLQISGSGATGCEMSVNGQGDTTFEVIEVSRIPAEGPLRDLEVVIRFGQTAEKLDMPCRGAQPTAPLRQLLPQLPFRSSANLGMGESWWTSYFNLGHFKEYDDRGLAIRGWTIVNRDGVLATQTLGSTCNGMCQEEATTLTLKGPTPPAAQ